MERRLRTWGAPVPRLAQTGCAPTLTESTGPDPGGEAADGGEVEIFVELDGGAVLRGHGQCQFTKFHGAQGLGGRLHEHAAETVPLIAGKDADLRGVVDGRGDFAGYRGGGEGV